jgi:hypothetical protein
VFSYIFLGIFASTSTCVFNNSPAFELEENSLHTILSLLFPNILIASGFPDIAAIAAIAAMTEA